VRVLPGNTHTYIYVRAATNNPFSPSKREARARTECIKGFALRALLCTHFFGIVTRGVIIITPEPLGP